MKPPRKSGARLVGTPRARQRIHLQGLAHGGEAVGRAEGRVWFVPQGAPGEIVIAEAVEEKPSYVRARLCDVVTPSEARRTPRCAHFGVCGGCQLQHVTDDAQRAAKSELIASALRKVTEHPMPELVCAEPFGYRVRAELHVVRDGDAVSVGFRAPRSHALVEPKECPVLAPDLEAAVLALIRVARTVPRAPEGRYELHLGEDGLALCVHVGGGQGGEAARWLGRVLELLPGITACAVEDAARVRFTLRDGRVRRDGLGYSPGVFGQGHGTLARAMRDEVVRFAKPSAASVLELFAGAGLFSLPLARTARRLVTVEEHPLACADAKASLEAEGLRADVRRGPAARIVAALVAEGARFDVVVLDPPRKGAAEVLPLCCDLAPARIVYVSCEPMTLARDLLELRPRGYEVVDLAAYDLFPQTFHVEVVALLLRRGLHHARPMRLREAP